MTSTSEGPGEKGALSIFAHLWLVFQAISDDSAPALLAIGLTPKTYFLLGAVGDHPFPAELARWMHLPPPTITYMIKQMEAAGFLERRAEPGDLRKFRLILTEAGQDAIERGRDAIGVAVRARLARLEPGEVGLFDRIVERLARPDVG